MSSAIVPLLIAGVVLYALIRGVNVYEAFAEGAAEGLPVLYRILPNLAAMLIAIGALRASGLVERFSALLSPLTNRIGLQSELLPLLFITTGCQFGIKIIFVFACPVQSIRQITCNLSNLCGFVDRFRQAIKWY